MRPLFLHGHSRPLTCVTFNRDGDLLFTAAKDATCAVWYSDNGQRIGTYDCGKGVVWSCDCSLDGTDLVCASADQKVLIFDVCSGRLKHEIKEQGPCRHVEWCRKPGAQNKFVVCHDSFGQASSKAINMWQVDDDSRKQLWSQTDFAGKCCHVHWGPYDQTIISGHEDGTIYVWDASNGEYIKEFRAHKQGVTSAAFTEDRMLMLTSCADGTCKLWDTVNFNCIKTYVTDRPLNCCAISPLFWKKGDRRKNHILMGGGQAAEDVTTTVSGEGKFQALIYNLIHGEEIGSCKGHFGPINSLQWLPNGAGYVSGGEDGFVRIYHFDEDYFNDEKYE